MSWYIKKSVYTFKLQNLSIKRVYQKILLVGFLHQWNRYCKEHIIRNYHFTQEPFVKIWDRQKRGLKTMEINRVVR